MPTQSKDGKVNTLFQEISPLCLGAFPGYVIIKEYASWIYFMFYCNLQPFQVHLKEKPSFFELDDINGTQILLRLCVDRWQNVRTNRVPYTQHDFYDWICKREKTYKIICLKRVLSSKDSKKEVKLVDLWWNQFMCLHFGLTMELLSSVTRFGKISPL